MPRHNAQDRAASILRLQASKVAALESSPGGHGKLTSALSAAACAGLERRCYLAARMAWLGDWGCKRELERLLWDAASELAARERWKRPRGVQYTRQLAALVLEEVCDPRKWQHAEPKCRWMWCALHDWHRYHRRHYEAIWTLYQGWLDVAADHIVRKLK